MARIGIYGGTFNPPHIGHITAAEQAADLLRLDKLLLMPDRIAPHKQLPADSATAEQRFKMLEMAVDGKPGLEVSDMELQREGPSYTYQTVLQLKQRYPKDELVLIMGTDMFLSFETWKNPRLILQGASLGVLCRGEKDEVARITAQKEKLEVQGADIFLAYNTAIPISSTDIRRMLIFGCALPYLPDRVGAYIQENRLYGAGKNYKMLPMDQLEQTVVSLLKPDRIAHVLGCRDTAVALAKHWGADETDAARAALLHDITKALPAPLQLTLCREYGMILDDFSQKNPKTLHALTGSLVIERIFGENESVVSAVRHHTTGKANMKLLEKIIYVADYMEPNRDFPGVQTLRALAFSDLDGALELGLTMTLRMLSGQGREVSPESREALEWLNRKEQRIC